MKLIKPNIAIIGCGSLGGKLAQLLAADSKTIGLKFLYLIDYDSVEEENEPFKMLKIIERDKYYTHVNKAYVLSEYLKDYKQRIFPITGKFPECLDSKPTIMNDSILIDCRDTNESDKRCHIKAVFDGKYYKLILNPKDSKGERTNYNFYDSHIVSTKLCIRIIDIITDKSFLDTQESSIIYGYDSKEYKYKLTEEDENVIHYFDNRNKSKKSECNI